MPQEKLQVDRRARYARVILPIHQRNEFTLDEIKLACSGEAPGFVTRLVNDLERDGVLQTVRENETTRFSWRTDRGHFSPDEWIAGKILGKQVTSAPLSDRPRERLLAVGAEKLSTAELLAILVRSGRPGESAVDAGRRISNQFSGCLEKLTDAAFSELSKASVAVGQSAYCQIMAGIELGRRVAEAAADAGDGVTRITGSRDAIEYCRTRFARLASDRRQEEFHVVTLDTKHQVIDSHQITVGTLSASLVHPREIFRPAIRDAAAAVILVHNHPSGDPTPSREDLAVTTKLEQAAEIIGIDVLDHIIVAGDCAISLQESRH